MNILRFSKKLKANGLTHLGHDTHFQIVSFYIQRNIFFNKKLDCITYILNIIYYCNSLLMVIKTHVSAI